MVWTSGLWVVQPGHETEFTEAWREFATWSQGAFPGGRAWLLRDRERPNAFLSIGPWPDDATIAAWRASPGFGERVGRIRALLESFEPRTLDAVVTVD
jgi:heme-degrading monooxygenase HmoA